MNPNILKAILGIGFTLTGLALLGGTMEQKAIKQAEKVNPPQPPKKQGDTPPKAPKKTPEPPEATPKTPDEPEKEVDPEEVIDNN